MTDPKTTELTNRERKLVTALRYAWHEINTIRARDGVPYHKQDGMPYCTERWWVELRDMCADAIEATTGDKPMPWPFPWEGNNNE